MEENDNDIRRLIFKYRSYTPIPFLLVMIWFAEPTVLSLVIGFAVVFVGELIRFWGVSIVGAETRTTGTVGGTYLITSGPFSYVRNPLYVGNMLLYAGVGIMSMALFPWMLLVAITWFYVQYYLIVSREEEYLAATFGGEFDVYRRNVRRFVPRLTPYRSAQPAAKTVDPSEGLASERRTLQAIVLVTALVMAKYLYFHFHG
ncbi:MAG TPA: isoprenylcysteine carboxylmethyltransferase family protein [Bacteroidota bacterium]|nr:isoprenylcysteine carboxylmethyltransferase family protein [Bacteroidota bacterium]